MKELDQGRRTMKWTNFKAVYVMKNEITNERLIGTKLRLKNSSEKQLELDRGFGRDLSRRTKSSGIIPLGSSLLSFTKLSKSY